MKRKAIGLLMIVVSLLITASVYAEEPINIKFIWYNGNIALQPKDVEFPDAQPFVDENYRTLVPIRFIAETMKMQVWWDEDTQTVTMYGYNGVGEYSDESPNLNSTIILKIGENKATVDGEEYTFDTRAILKDERTFVPLRFVAETMGAAVDYSEDTNTVEIWALSNSTKKSMVDFADSFMKKIGQFDYMTAQDGYFDGYFIEPHKYLELCREQQLQNDSIFNAYKARLNEEGFLVVEGIQKDNKTNTTIKKAVILLFAPLDPSTYIYFKTYVID